MSDDNTPALKAKCRCVHERDWHIPGADGFLYECVRCNCPEYRESSVDTQPAD